MLWQSENSGSLVPPALLAALMLPVGKEAGGSICVRENKEQLVCTANGKVTGRFGRVWLQVYISHQQKGKLSGRRDL